MRTKSLLAAAALIAAGVLTSEAQSNVYSLNVVGYVNLTLSPGFNLVSAQLNSSSGSRAINVLLTNAPTLADGSTFFQWNAPGQNFTESAIWVQGEAQWYNADGSALATDSSPLGNAFFIKNEGPTATMTLVGEVKQGSTAMTIPANYNFAADCEPVSQQIKTNGFTIVDSASLFTFNALAQSYTEALVGVGASSGGPDWYNADGSAVVLFAPLVGQGFVHFNPGSSMPWTRNFTVQ